METVSIKRLVIGTKNEGKVSELAGLFGTLPVRLVSLNEFENVPEVEETGKTFLENAILKARAFASMTGLPAVADDSGLEVEALDGAPGVLSARYAGETSTFPEKIERLLAEVEAAGAADRSARFVCSMAVADGLPAAAIVLISYPLHPPGKPDRLRVEHFPQIEVPCLFVGGTRDPFGTPDELEHHTGAIAGPVTHVWMEGAGHALKGNDAELATVVADWIAGL